MVGNNDIKLCLEEMGDIVKQRGGKRKLWEEDEQKQEVDREARIVKTKVTEELIL